MSGFRSELAKKCGLFTLIGLGLGILFGLFPDFKSRFFYGEEMYFVIKTIEGALFGAILGLVFGILNYAYERSRRLRPIVGALLCFFVGYLLVGLWAFMYESDHGGVATKIRSAESMQIELALRDGLWGGLIGAGLGLVAGAVDQLIQRKRSGNSICLRRNHLPRQTMIL